MAHSLACRSMATPWTSRAPAPPWYGNLPDYAQQGAMSVKVAWKQLDETEIDSGRYYTREAYYENNTLDPTDFCSGETGEPITVGLVGMHILRLTPTTGTTWFWSSFEHVDNVTGPNASFNAGCAAATSGYTRRGTCTDAVPDIETDPWLPEYPPLNPAEVDINGNPINYPDGLCGPQDSSSIFSDFPYSGNPGEPGFKSYLERQRRIPDSARWNTLAILRADQYDSAQKPDQGLHLRLLRRT